jgi:hypothetical protein
VKSWRDGYLESLQEMTTLHSLPQQTDSRCAHLPAHRHIHHMYEMEHLETRDAITPSTCHAPSIAPLSVALLEAKST